jgi:Spy/CpxP family protein refolding chaperone
MTASTHRPALVAVVLACAAAAAWAGGDPMGPPGPRHGPPPFLRHLYPPRLVMRNADVITLTAAQRQAIGQAIVETRSELADLERKREAAADALGTLVAGPRVDEAATLTRAGELMETEQAIKRAHLRLLIRVKNQLTPEQQKTLDGLKADWRAGRRRRLRERLRPREPDDG